MIRLTGGVRRVLVASAALGGLLLGTAGACDTGASPSAPPGTVAPTAGRSDDDSGDDRGRGRGGDDGRDGRDARDGSDGRDGGDARDGRDDDSGRDGGESEGPDDGGPSGRGNEGESR